MNQKLADKITRINYFLQSAGVKVSNTNRGLRAWPDNGYPVDIYAVKGHPAYIRAMLTIEESDPLKRQAYVESAHNFFSEALNKIAGVEPFHLSMESGNEYIYYSILEDLGENFDDTPIEINEDAIEIVDDEKTVDDTEADDLAMFELDFGIEGDNRLKVVKSLAEEAIERMETVDAKTLRQNLDMMRLKRSSVVRLALTRIFRSAAEVPELETAIQKEAKKIVSPEDRAELQTVKSLSINGFFDPVVDLLWQEVFSDE